MKKKKKNLALVKFDNPKQEIDYLERALIPYLKRLLVEAGDRLKELLEKK